MVLILWKPHISEHFPEGYTPKGEVHGVDTGGHMHEDLLALIKHLEKDGREWSIAKIECDSSQIAPDPPCSGW